MARSRKTTHMLLFEARDPQGRTIEQIMLDAYQKAGSQNRAAHRMGITPAAFSLWVRRLEITLPVLKESEEVAA